MRRVWLGLSLVAAMVATTVVHGRLLHEREAFPKELDLLYVPAPEYLRVMSLGYREALADLLWVRALIYSGRHIGENDLGDVTRLVEGVTGLAPRFHRVYVWGGVTPVYGGGKQITRKMVDQSIENYRRGLTHFPESHQLLYPLGMLLIHQVPSTPGYTEQEKKEMKAEGIAYIRRAAAFGADPLVRQYAATLVADHGTDQLARQFLESQLAQAEDPDYRRMLRARLQRLQGGAASVERIEAIRREFIEEQLEQAPYLPDSVYAVIADDHVGAASHKAR